MPALEAAEPAALNRGLAKGGAAQTAKLTEELERLREELAESRAAQEAATDEAANARSTSVDQREVRGTPGGVDRARTRRPLLPEHQPQSR